MTFKELKDKFGLHAKTIRSAKKDLQASRAADDPSPAYWFQHPEVPNDEESVPFFLFGGGVFF